MFNLIFINLIVTATSLLLLKYVFRFKSLSDCIISFFLLYFTQIILSLEFLGIFGKLYLSYLIILNLFILALVFMIIKNILNLAENKTTKNFQIASSFLNPDKVERMLLALILGFGIIKICINLVNPPFGWDNLNYHFTFPVEWLKNHNLSCPIVVSCDPSPTYYPINGSLFFLWFMLPLKNVFLADLGQVPFFIMAFFAVYSLARKLKLSGQYAFFSAAVFSLVPNYFKQLSIAYVDVMVAALFLSSLNYLFLLAGQGSLRNIMLFSISLGIMLGVKTTALPYVAILAIPFIYFCFRRFSLPKSLLILLIFILLLTITGGYSYIRNFVDTGNPLYPLNFRLFNKVIFKGVIESFVYRAHVLPQDYSLGKILFSEGLGAQTVLFLLPAIFLGLPVALLKKRNDLNFNLLYFLILPYLLIFTYRFIIPLANLRYIYCLLGVGFIIAFYIAQTLKLPKGLIKLLVVICALASAAELAKRQELLFSFLFSIALFFLLGYLLKIIRDRSPIKLIIPFLIFVSLALFYLERNYVENEYTRYLKIRKYSGFWTDATEAWIWLNDNTSGNNIAYIGRPVPFPLYGKNFKNNVYYVSVNSVEPAKLHYFANSSYSWGYDGESVHKSFAERDNYRGKADYHIWLNNLLAKRTDYLFVYSLHQIKGIDYPIEDKWAAEHPQNFTLAAKFDTIYIYKIIRK